MLLQSFSGGFDIAGLPALILIVALLVMALTSLLDLAEGRLFGVDQGSTDGA